MPPYQKKTIKKTEPMPPYNTCKHNSCVISCMHACMHAYNTYMHAYNTYMHAYNTYMYANNTYK